MAAGTNTPDARVSAYKRIALLTARLRKGLDIIEPGKHCIVSLGAENPSVATMHGSSLSALDDKLVR